MNDPHEDLQRLRGKLHVLGQGIVEAFHAVDRERFERQCGRRNLSDQAFAAAEKRLASATKARDAAEKDVRKAEKKLGITHRDPNQMP